MSPHTPRLAHWDHVPHIGDGHDCVRACSAPALLAVLKEAVGHIGIVRFGAGLEADAIRDRATAAIAKATEGA